MIETAKEWVVSLGRKAEKHTIQIREFRIRNRLAGIQGMANEDPAAQHARSSEMVKRGEHATSQLGRIENRRATCADAEPSRYDS